MGAKASSARSSDIGYDGAAIVILGSAAHITLSSASAQNNNVLIPGPVPFDSYLEELILSIHTAVTVSTTGVPISLGNTASTDVFLSSYLVTATTTGVFRLNLSATTVLDRKIPAGTFLKFSLPISISTTGVFSLAAVLVPRTA